MAQGVACPFLRIQNGQRMAFRASPNERRLSSLTNGDSMVEPRGFTPLLSYPAEIEKKSA